MKHHQGKNKFRMTDLKLIRQELKEWLKGLESKKIALHSLIKQITVYTNATLEVTYNAGYLSNQTRALDIPRTGLMPVNIYHSSREFVPSSSCPLVSFRI